MGGVEEPDPPFADSMGPATTYAPTTSTAITAIAAPIIHFGFPAGAGAGGGDGGETTRGGGGGGGAAAGAGSGPAPAGAPHCSQNFPPTGSGAPHFGQAREAGSDAPHFSQNRSASAAGAPQAGQTRVDETSTMKSLCTRLLPESIYTIPNVPRRREPGSPHLDRREKDERARRYPGPGNCVLRPVTMECGIPGKNKEGNILTGEGDGRGLAPIEPSDSGATGMCRTCRRILPRVQGVPRSSGRTCVPGRQAMPEVRQ